MASGAISGSDHSQGATGVNTIAALATAPAPAGVAIVRMSGPLCRILLKQVFSSKIDPLSNPRLLVLGDVLEVPTRLVIDSSLVVFMPGPNSFTGDDTVEFQLHGSMLLVQKLLRSLYALGVLPAEPGEFTKRAFLNGKLDLMQAEAIADLVSAGSEEALILAGEQLKGRTSGLVDSIAEPLRNLLAETEASLDFSDDGVDPAGIVRTRGEIVSAQAQVARLIESYDYGSRVKDGLRVLLFGQPNVGKSSLLNAFVGSRRALVSAQPGTTRDVIEETVNFGGHRLVISDVAGVRDTHDEVESLGVALARERLDWAQVILLVVDGSSPVDFEAVLAELEPYKARVWLVRNKIDLGCTDRSTLGSSALGSWESTASTPRFEISALTGIGLNELRAALIAKISEGKSEGGSVVTSERQRMCLVSARSHLDAAQLACGVVGDEIVAHHIRLSLGSLEELVGRTYTDDLLGRIFSKFCIGK